MYCEKCGAKRNPSFRFCTECGYDLRQSDPKGQETYDWDEALYPIDEDYCAGDVLKWGILGLAFSAYSPIPWLGWIFSVKARKKANAYKRRFGEPHRRAKVGSILGNVGRIVGMVRTIAMIVVALCYVVYYVLWGLLLAGIFQALLGG